MAPTRTAGRGPCGPRTPRRAGRCRASRSPVNSAFLNSAMPVLRAADGLEQGGAVVQEDGLPQPRVAGGQPRRVAEAGRRQPRSSGGQHAGQRRRDAGAAGGSSRASARSCSSGDMRRTAPPSACQNALARSTAAGSASAASASRRPAGRRTGRRGVLRAGASPTRPAGGCRRSAARRGSRPSDRGGRWPPWCCRRRSAACPAGRRGAASSTCAAIRSTGVQKTTRSTDGHGIAGQVRHRLVDAGRGPSARARWPAPVRRRRRCARPGRAAAPPAPPSRRAARRRRSASVAIFMAVARSRRR